LSGSRTVLLVDDSPEDRAVHRRYLERTPDIRYIVSEATSGDEGLERCRQDLPDCVLLDYRMNDMDGLEFLSRLTKDGTEEPPCPVVMLTGGANESLAIQALKSGAHDYLVKGRITVDGLRIAIDTAIRNATLRKQFLRSQATLRTALDTMLDCFAIAAAVRDDQDQIVDFRLQYVNDEACRFAGLTRDTLLGRTFSAVLPLHVRPELFREYVLVTESGHPVAKEASIFDGHPALLQVSLDVRVAKIDDGIAVAWRDVTEHRKAEEIIRRMNTVLERRVEERTSELKLMVKELEGFTYSVSHDLRTPLRAIVSTSHILMDELGDGLNEEHRGLLKRQAHNARRLGDLIDDLLKLSRLSRQEMRPEEIDISQLAQSVADEVLSRSWICPPQFEIAPNMKAAADATLLSLVFMNLFENACKFSPEGGVVRVGQKDGAFFVRDEGIGFDVQYARKVFQPFERLVRDDQFPGTGIGLANVQRIIQRHDGKIWAESEPGQGSTFWFTLDPGSE